MTKKQCFGVVTIRSCSWIPWTELLERTDHAVDEEILRKFKFDIHDGCYGSELANPKPTAKPVHVQWKAGTVTCFFLNWRSLVLMLIINDVSLR